MVKLLIFCFTVFLFVYFRKLALLMNTSGSLAASRNLLYDIKKQTYTTQQEKPSLLYETDWRVELNDLRSNMRRKQSEIIRLKNRIDDLQAELRSVRNRSAADSAGFGNTKNSKAEVEKSNFPPLVFQNQELKAEIQQLTQKLMVMNGDRNDLEKRNREILCELQHIKKRNRELQIIEKMRSERFEEEVKNIKPVVITVEENKELQQGCLAVAETLRSGIADITFGVFMASANACEQRKLSSLIVFKSNINQLRKTSRNGFTLATRVYLAFKDIIKMYLPKYAQIENPDFRTTFNTWMHNSLVEVSVLNSQKQSKKEEEELPLYRLMALYYRTKYPLKGEVMQVDLDLQVYLEDMICTALHKLLVTQAPIQS